MAATCTFFFGIVDRDFNDHGGETFVTTIRLDSTVILLKEQLKQECDLDDFHVNKLFIYKNDLVLDTEVEDVSDTRIETIARVQEFKRNHDRLPEEIVEMASSRKLARYRWDFTPNLVHFFVQVPVRKDNKSDQVSGAFMNKSIMEYKDLVINITEFQSWHQRDLALNGLFISAEGVTLVTAYEKMLDKPRIAGAETTSQLGGTDVAFCGPIALTDLERMHVDELSIWPWESFWEQHTQNFMDDGTANNLFFYRFIPKINSFPSDCGITMQFGEDYWPYSLILMGPGDVKDRCRTFLPRSDVLIMSSSLPRLLVEVQSKVSVGDEEMPEDLVRMLLQAGFVVRFANGYLDTYKERKDFVLVAIYLWKNGMVIRYIIYQTEDGTIACKETQFDIKVPEKRVGFAAQLYNLLDYLNCESERAKSMTEKVDRFGRAMAVARQNLPILCSRSQTKGSTNDDEDGSRDDRRRKYAESYAALREHGYEPHSKGNTRGSDSNLKEYAHIFEIWAKDDPTRRTLIAKRIRRRTDELAILRSLNDSEPRSDRIITLIDSFDSPVGPWAILPRLSPVMDVVKRTFASYDLCWQLIEGVAFLHGQLIAHRDIKPENLVVDGERCLKIIDFDIAIQLTSEDAEVSGGQCGTDAWMAPEGYYERPAPYSPIQADRWSCGSVIEKFLKEGLWKKGKNIDVLKSISERLLSTKRKERPSLLEWKAWKEEEALKDVEGGPSGASSVQRMRSRPDETETRVAKKLRGMESEASGSLMDVDACEST